MRQHRSRHVERGVMDAGGGDARHQNFQPQLLAENAHLDDKPADKPRPHPVVEILEVERRPVGGDHYLSPGVDHCIKRVRELGMADFPCRNCRSSISST